MAFPLGRLLRQDVTTVGFPPFKGTGTGYFEPFRSAAIGFDLWHCLSTPHLCCTLLLFGAQHHHHLTAFHLWFLLHFAMLLEVFLYPLQ